MGDVKVQKFWQTNWIDIEFSSFTKLNSTKQADEVFYEKFYTEFFKKFNSYEDLPEQYKKDKNLAKTNNQLISSKKIKIEHVFAYTKNFRILQRLHYYKMNKIELFFQSIANIYNLSQI